MNKAKRKILYKLNSSVQKLPEEKKEVQQVVQKVELSQPIVVPEPVTPQEIVVEIPNQPAYSIEVQAFEKKKNSNKNKKPVVLTDTKEEVLEVVKEDTKEEVLDQTKEEKVVESSVE